MRFRKKLIAVTPIVCALVFLLLGFLKDAWHPGWVVFLAIPFISIMEGFTRSNLKAKIVTLTVILCAVTFVVLGVVFGAWHPGWLVFFAIPIVSTLLYA